MSENKADQLRAEMRGRHAAELTAPGWKGLHNEPNRHRARGDMDAWCDWCGDCAEDQPCRCCLAAEVQLLRAQVQRVRDAIALHDGGMIRGTYILDILDGGEVPLNNYGDDIVYLDGGDA